MVIDSSHLKHRKTIACRFAFWTVMATCNDVYLFPAKRLCDGSFLRFYGAGLGLEQDTLRSGKGKRCCTRSQRGDFRLRMKNGLTLEFCLVYVRVHFGIPLSDSFLTAGFNTYRCDVHILPLVLEKMFLKSCFGFADPLFFRQRQMVVISGYQHAPRDFCRRVMIQFAKWENAFGFRCRYRGCMTKTRPHRFV